jgi:hypothetical protein
MKTSEQIDSLTPYYDPQLKLLKVHKIDALDKWHCDGFRVGFWRLYWNRQPGAEVHFKSRVQPLSPDRLVLVPAYTVLSQRLPRPPVGHWFGISSSTLRSTASATKSSPSRRMKTRCGGSGRRRRPTSAAMSTPF